MQSVSPQPNLVAEENMHGFPWRFWLLLVLTGIGTGLGASALMGILRAVQHAAWFYRHGDFFSAVERTGSGHRVAVLAIGGLVGAGGLLVRHFVVRGHGGEVSSTIWFKKGKFPFLRTCTSAVLSIVIVGLGASVGREGAPKQVGAAIASQLAEWFSLNPAQRRLLAACGAGAGMAAVYNVPVGGALFAMEVLLGTLALPLVIPALATSFIATAVSWLFLPNHPTYTVPSLHASLPQILWALAFAPLAGLASVAYVRTIVWADRNKPQGWLRIVLPLTVFTALGVAAIWFPQLLGNGKDTAQLAFLNQIDIRLLFVLMALKVAATSGCLRSGVPGGLFTPTVTVGALLGGGCGRLWTLLGFPAAGGSFAIVGAGAVLAAATQGPVSAIVLILELTYRIDGIMIPLIIGVCGATIVAGWLEPKSIYSAGVHFGRASASDLAPAVPTAFDDLLRRDRDMVSAAAHYSAVLKTLLASRASSVFVLDENGKLSGQIRARDALAANREGPLDTTTASDLVTAVTPVCADAPRPQVLQQLIQATDPLPVIDDQCRLIGILEPEPSAMEKG